MPRLTHYPHLSEIVMQSFCIELGTSLLPITVSMSQLDWSEPSEAEASVSPSITIEIY